MKELKILRDFCQQNDSGEYFINTIDVGIELDSLLDKYTSEEIGQEIKTFVELPIKRIKFQDDVQNIIGEIVDYSLK